MAIVVAYAHERMRDRIKLRLMPDDSIALAIAAITASIKMVTGNLSRTWILRERDRSLISLK